MAFLVFCRKNLVNDQLTGSYYDIVLAYLLRATFVYKPKRI